MFETLRGSGRRLRRGPLTVTYAALDGQPDGPFLAFAIGRRFGPAVARNRARRRLRAAFRQARVDLGAPVPYALLVQARPAVLDAPFPQLVRTADEVLRAVIGRSER
jgi:ribonuclease P protein component